MPVVVIGLNHRTAPLDLLERTTVPADGLPKALADVCSRPNVAEAVVLSTCNRTEVYAVVDRFHGAYQDIRDFLCDLAGAAPEELVDHLSSQFDDEAVLHLFEVASGLDSAVLGESEILGQVRDAWECARHEGAARGGLNLLFRHALEAAKRARTETGIGRSTASVSSSAVAMATEHLGGLEGRQVLVVGAGGMGTGVASALRQAGVGEMLVANRTLARAIELAARVDGTAVRLEHVPSALMDVDVLLTCTGAGVVLFEHDTITEAMALRDGRPLLVVDIAVPRDVDRAVGSVDGVTLLDLDDLRDFADRGLAERRVEAAQARAIALDEVRRYVELATARQAAPLVGRLHARAEALRADELARYQSRLGALDDEQRDAVEAVTRSVIAKLLHEPSVRLKGAAGSPRGERYAEVLRDLFDLG